MIILVDAIGEDSLNSHQNTLVKNFRDGTSYRLQSKPVQQLSTRSMISSKVFTNSY